MHRLESTCYVITDYNDIVVFTGSKKKMIKELKRLGGKDKGYRSYLCPGKKLGDIVV